MGDKNITSRSSLSDMLREYISITDRIDALTLRRSEAEKLIRERVRRAIDFTPHLEIEEAAASIRDYFPGLPSILGLRTYQEAAAWLMKNGD